MLILQLSAGQGPAECCLAVAKAYACLLKEADKHGLSVSVIESVEGAEKGTFASILLSIDGENERQFANQWQGVIQWICVSPYRPRHKRKNWFIGCELFASSNTAGDNKISYRACRASGPGGQHVNKTDSAIQATHLATGISVKVTSERSQHANKRLATQLIAYKLAKLADSAVAAKKQQQWQSHLTLERGNPVKLFKGSEFRLVK
ncbi:MULTISPECIES: peptide chain release factor H [Corallincola]|uniref:Peptide chain release factor H n=2 Tax=Corallincola TaxID=1775176 RepID=A0A368N5M8_9GAMM|nr:MULTISPECIES: peptide chain release factor H [Corallincola]RCU45526.1 peptide chain release factor H [Corallincola holothuriorum]TAA40960.1 peptide chain release factor H [Corallincola spongiicola]